MAPDRYALLVGSIIALEGSKGPFRTCAYCGFHQGRIRDGKGPHIGQVVCDNCGRHTAWIGRDHMEAMLAGKSGTDDLIDDEDAA